MKIIITGATGMVGEGVLHECIANRSVEKILSVSRKQCGVTDDKLTEVLVPDFFDLENVTQYLPGYDACFFCLGVSSLGLKEPEYFRLTHTLTTGFAKKVLEANPEIIFCYISGANTRSDEQGAMWARVKGKTENDLNKLGFKRNYNFRPGFMKPTPGLKRTLKAYKFMGWLYPLFKVIFPNTVSTLAEVGQAMINIVHRGYENKVVEVKDIKILAV